MICMGDLDFFQELIDNDLPAREFAVRLIRHELYIPTLSVETIRSWNDRLIIRVASIWIKSNPELAGYFRGKLTIDLIKNIIKIYMRKLHNIISKQYEFIDRVANSTRHLTENLVFVDAQRINDMIGCNSAIESAQRISDILGKSSALDSVQKMSAMIGISPAIESAQRISDMIGCNSAIGSAQQIGDILGKSSALDSVQKMSAMIEISPAIESAQRISDMIGCNSAIGSAQQIGDILGKSSALDSVQKMSAMIGISPAIESAQRISDMIGCNSAIGSAQQIGDMIGHNSAFERVQIMGEILAKQFSAIDLQTATITQIPLREIALSQASNSEAASLYKSYMDYVSLNSGFQQKFSQTENGFPSIEPELAARELFITTKLIKSIFSGEEPNDPDETEIIKEKLSIESIDKLRPLLIKLDPELLNLWIGAKECTSSDNPDNARHFNISLRELFTHVLHKLAPDEEIKSWSVNPEDFSRERPTRDARLRYIYRGIDDKSFSPLIKKFISFTLELMVFLNQGTHKQKINMGDEQFKLILMQIEFSISQLIEISQRQPMNRQRCTKSTNIHKEHLF